MSYYSSLNWDKQTETPNITFDYKQNNNQNENIIRGQKANNHFNPHSRFNANTRDLIKSDEFSKSHGKEQLEKTEMFDYQFSYLLKNPISDKVNMDVPRGGDMTRKQHFGGIDNFSRSPINTQNDLFPVKSATLPPIPTISNMPARESNNGFISFKY